MAALAHRIRSLRWGVRARSQPEAFAVRKWLRDELHGTLLPAVDRVFNEAAAKDEVLHLPKLEVHLEVATPEEIIDRLPELLHRRLAELLRSAMRDTAAPAAQAGEPAPSFTRATAEESDLQTLARYLETGSLPWPLAGSDRKAILTQLRSAAAASLGKGLATQGADFHKPFHLDAAMAFYFRLLQLLPEEEWVAVAKAAAAKLPNELGGELVAVVAALAYGEIGKASRYARLAAAAVALGVASLDSTEGGGPAAAVAPTVKEALAAVEDSIAPLPENAAAFWRRWLNIGSEDLRDQPSRSEPFYEEAPAAHPPGVQEVPEATVPSSAAEDGIPISAVSAVSPSVERRARSAGRKTLQKSPAVSGEAASRRRRATAQTGAREPHEGAVPGGEARGEGTGAKFAASNSGIQDQKDAKDATRIISPSSLKSLLSLSSLVSAPKLAPTGGEGLPSTPSPSVGRETRAGGRKTLQKRSAAGVRRISREADVPRGAPPVLAVSVPVRTESPAGSRPRVREEPSATGVEARPKGARKAPRDRAVALHPSTSVERKREPSGFRPHLDPRSQRLRDAAPKPFGVFDRVEVGVEGPDLTVFPLAVPHAGLILLHPFLSRFFESTGIKDPRQPDLPAATLPRAAALLHLLAAGEDEVFEFELGFVKILLGLEPAFALPVSGGLLGESDREEADALLQAVLGYWTALKNTSAAALRQSFLQRRGLVREDEQGFRLQVEPEPFDVLLSTLPWGLATVKLPWMKEPIFTDWPTP
jgi:hypothetical protein